VYSTVFQEFGIRCDGEQFNQAVYATWDEMNRAVPVGVDRYTHFADGEDGYWKRFVTRSVELASGELIGENLAAAALQALQRRFGSAEAWRVFDDVPPALRALRDAGARLAVVSNWDSRLPDVLRVLELDPWFETVVVSHFEGVEKPNGELFERALERMNVPADRVLHVGDSPELDGVGARNAGIDFVWVDRRTPAEPNTIPDFSGLLEIARDGLDT
jgi:putative hydrolase of the HAD superfamily